MQQNFDNFLNYLELLNFSFPIIGLTETWLSESTCGLFGIDGYEFVERHRDVEAVLAYLLEITWILNIAMISHILMNFVNAYV